MNKVRFALWVGISAMLVAGFVWSVQAPAQPAPQPEVSYTLTVTAAEANIIGGALAKLPYDTVAVLLGKLQKQITEQEQAARDVKPKADGAPEPKKP